MHREPASQGLIEWAGRHLALNPLRSAGRESPEAKAGLAVEDGVSRAPRSPLSDDEDLSLHILGS